MIFNILSALVIGSCWVDIIGGWVAKRLGREYKGLVERSIEWIVKKVMTFRHDRKFRKEIMAKIIDEGYKIVSPTEEAKIDYLIYEALMWEDYVDSHADRYMQHQDPDSEWWRLVD